MLYCILIFCDHFSATDDKGPVLGWIHAIEAYQKNGIDLPVNLKFIFEGMEESGSEGLEELVAKEKNGFLTVRKNEKIIYFLS